MSQPFYLSESEQKAPRKIFELVVEAVSLWESEWKSCAAAIPVKLWETMGCQFFSTDFHKEEHEVLIMFYNTGGPAAAGTGYSISLVLVWWRAASRGVVDQ